MDKPKGGRGHTAPYDTKQMRVPVGLEPQVQELINRYRDWISEADTQTVGTNNPPRLLDKPVDSFIRKPVDKLVSEVENLNKLVDKLTQERNSLDAEVNQLHTRNGELNLEIAELKEQLKPVDKLSEIAVGSGNKPVDKLNDLVVGSGNKPVDKLSDLATGEEDKPVDKLNDLAVGSGNKPVDKLSDLATGEEDKPVDKLNDLKVYPMKHNDLARRLGKPHSAIGYHKKKGDLVEWSRQHDPDQIGWRSVPESKLFYPVEH